MNNDRHNRRFLPHAVQNFLWGFSRAGRHHQQQQVHNHIQDREMTPVEDIEVHEPHLTPAVPPQSNNHEVDTDNHSDTSMPDLQSVSDSDSDSQDARDVEMHVVEDDQNNEWTDDEDNIPPLESTSQSERNDRRARVDDDSEPSQPTHAHTRNPTLPSNDEQSPRTNIPPWTFGLGTARPPPFDLRRLFPLPPQAGPHDQHAQANPQTDDNTPPRPGDGRPHVHAHAYVLAMDMNGRPVPIPMGPPPPPVGGTPQPQGIPIFDFIIGAGPNGGMFNGPAPPFGTDVPTWAEVMQMFGREIEEREDPDRAKNLVAGLEQVPEGLVKRMIRVGGAPGGHVDEAQAQNSETPGCAICWDSLLTETSEGEAPVKEETTIISLPCSHVFHASCLVPWFSKPRHTTCPTCRFDIDPENLTYNPRRVQPREPSGQPPSASNQEEQSVGEHPPQPQEPEVPAQAEQPNVPQPQNDEPPPDFPNFNTFIFPPPPPSPNPGDAPRNIHHHHHGHTHGPGFTVDFTWQVPNNGEQDDARIAEELQNQASAFVQQFLGGINGFTTFGGPMPRAGPRPPPPPFGNPSGTSADQRRPRKEWSPPPAPGPTLRQRIETKEREAGLRCDDASCGIGPSDEDPYPSQLENPSSMKQVSISQPNHNLHACLHKFHPSCLVSADRCSGWGEGVEREKPQFEVVACPMCRAIGNVSREVWDEGAEALLV